MRVERIRIVGNLFPGEYDLGIPHLDRRTHRTYREYDTGPLKDMEFTGPPQLEWLPYKDKTVFQTVGVKTNGSRTFKQGIEFSLSTRRIRALATKLIVSGAYFKTRYENSEPQYVLTTVQLAEGTPYPYIGLYDQDDNTFHEVCNTNFLLDTQIPKLGLIFSTSFQCQWFSGMKAEWCNPAPTSYLDLQLQEHPFTAESAADGIFAAYDPRQRIERSLSLPSHAFQYERQSQNLETALPRPAQHCDFRKPAVHIQSFVQKRDQRTGTPLFQPLFRHGTQLQTVMR